MSLRASGSFFYMILINYRLNCTKAEKVQSPPSNHWYLTYKDKHLRFAFCNFTLLKPIAMKKILLALIFAVVIHTAYGKNLSAFFSYCTFDQPGKSPYIETYLNVSGTSVQLGKNADNKLQG